MPIMVKFFFYLSCVIMAPSRDETTYEIKFAQVRLSITTLTKMQMPSVNNMILTHNANAINQ